MSFLDAILPTTTPAITGPRDPFGTPPAPLSDRERQRIRRDAAAAIVAARNTCDRQIAELTPQREEAAAVRMKTKAADDAALAELNRLDYAIACAANTRDSDISRAERQLLDTADERIDAAARRFWRWYHAARQSSPPPFSYKETLQPDGSILRTPQDWAALLIECVASIRAAATAAENLRFEVMSPDEISARLEAIEDQIHWSEGARRSVAERGIS